MSATECIEALKAISESAPSVQKKGILVYSEKELLSASKLADPPFLGVVYEGIRPLADGGNQSLSNAIWMVIVVAYPEQGIDDGENKKLQAITTLDELRKLLRGKKSPTGHFWKFQMEAQAKLEKGNLVWLQRWTTAFNG